MLQKAVNEIFHVVGNIVKISSVYESPSMGFEGPSFLNCVIQVSSFLTAEEILAKVLDIEQKLGRERSDTPGYVSRSIDIDILFFGAEVIHSETLSIPHPEIKNRKFVLQPMAEVNASFLHPIVAKNMVWMLAKTEDQTTLSKLSKWLRNPKKSYDLSGYNYIAVEGNIGSGKTSLATQLAADFNAKLILERFKDNPFLPKFYEDPGRYAFSLEMSFLADRYQQLIEDISQFDLFKDCVIADYEAYKSLLFAKITLSEEEFILYKKLFHLMHKELPKPDLYVYLHQSTDRLMEQIKKRGRDFEQDITPEYLEKISEGYLSYIKENPHLEIKIIDVSSLDFVNQRNDYLYILKQLVS